MNDELLTYLRQAFAQGVSEEEVRQALLQTGWAANEVNGGIAFLKTGGTAFRETARVVSADIPTDARAPLILIVDDEANFLEIFSVKLGAAGFRTATAKNGKEAIAAAEKLLPDLVLMDIHLPGESGTDIALSIKQNPKTEQVKIAFLTSMKDPWPAMTGDRAKITRELGMEDYIEKTDDLDKVTQKIHEILNSKIA